MLGFSRDAYYKKVNRGKEKKANRAKVLALVDKEREEQPRMGGKKLYNEIGGQIKEAGINCGRDRFFILLKQEDKLVVRKKRFKRTTYSNHPYAVSPNLIEDLEISRPNQVFVTDITYISVGKDFAYLFLVTDAYSRKIVGYHLSRDLAHHSALLALNNALKTLANPEMIICHSDRGTQYCCHAYIGFLNQYGMKSSMTNQSHCYQNAIAERVNGILKDEFDLDSHFECLADAKLQLDKAVRIYNNKRKHWSLGLKTPAQVYALAA